MSDVQRRKLMWDMWEFSALSSQFFCKPKIIIKYKVGKKEKVEYNKHPGNIHDFSNNSSI
jgi:hypothetical protein